MKRTLHVDLDLSQTESGQVDKWDLDHGWRLSISFSWSKKETFADRFGRVIRHQSVMDEILITAATP